MPKHVVGVSIGSSKRDKRTQISVLDEEITLERIGTNGNFDKAIQLIKELDGKVDAFGLGGIDLYLFAAGHRYVIRDALKLARAARKTPVLDGSGLKHTLERRAIESLDADIGWRGKKVLMTSAVDRFGMAEALWDKGADMLYGDLIFGVGLPVPIRTLAGLQRLARLLLPVFVKLPFAWLYPTGDKQDKRVQDWRRKYYHWADVIAGDWLYINRYMPDDLTGKIILTNTTTEDDVEALKVRGARMLITTTVRMDGRSFGTNVMEALFVALAGRYPLSEADYLGYMDQLGFKPEVLELNQG